MGYDPDWPSKGEGKGPDQMKFWRFCLAFAALEAVIAAAAAFCGCASVDPAVAYGIYTNVVSHIPGSAEPVVPGGAASGGEAESASSADDPKEEPAARPQTAETVALDWSFGGFKGSKAQEDSRCRISGLKVGSSGLSFKWHTDIPSDWKRQTDKKGSWVIAAVFFQDASGKWVGGKFDLIDRARSTRDFKNIDSGYNGWNASAFRAARKHAFCVCSADGKWRSNIVED